MAETTPTSIPIAIAVVEYDGSYLLGQRPADVPLAGYWEFPGGKVEAGETAEAAAVRECWEEAGLQVVVQSSLSVHEHEYRHGRLRLQFFLCVPAHPIGLPRAPYRWVAAEQLNDLQFPEGNRRVLEQLSRR